MSKRTLSEKPRLVLIAGPTASGKSARAMAMAQAEGGTIINADASQTYRDLRVLTARPSTEEEGRVPHMLYGDVDAAEAGTAADWAARARHAIAETRADGRLPMLVGGTGLYLRTLIEGIAPVPPVDPEVRASVRAMSGPAAHDALETADPATARRLHPNDTARCQRALEVVRSTGRTLSQWHADRTGGIGRDVALDIHVVDPPVAELYARCDERVHAMVAAGALDEVAALMARGLDPALPAMRAIGVRPFAAVLAGSVPLSKGIAEVQQQTRNYAKRQRTWFRHQLPGGNSRHGEDR